MTKKTLGLLFFLTTFLLAGCTNTAQNTTEVTEVESTEDIHIVATSFHEYDWLSQVIGDQENFSITLLINDGVDLHSYEPTAEDIAAITSADLFIYNGGESDTWVDDILATSPELNALNVIEVLDDNVQMSVLVEGMEESEDHDHDDEDIEESTEEEHDHDDEDTEESTEEEHDHDDEDTEESTEEEHDHDDEDTEEETHSHEDEHIWLSLKNAVVVCEYFSNAVSELDPENADIYEANAQTYITELNTLDEAYETMVSEAARDTIIVTDRFPFLYLCTDYDINYYAAFEGCSAETEASFETIIFLAEKIDEYNVNYLLTVENGLTDLATTISASTTTADQEILVLNSIQSVTQDDIDAGTTYYSIMEENLEILTLALSE